MGTSSEASRDFTPAHCPRRNCRYHKHSSGPWPFVKRGHYLRKSDGRRVQIYRCKACLGYFSHQTFSLSYWQKRPEILPCLITKIDGGMCEAQIARDLRCAPSTVIHQRKRLARHLLLKHLQYWRYQAPKGPVVIDGLRTFEFSQYWPYDLNVAVDQQTSFIYGHTDSELPRTGRMTRGQRKRRDELVHRYGRPDHKATVEGIQALLSPCLPEGGQALVISDMHEDYPRALQRLRCQIEHRRISSRQARTRANPLYEVNLLDLRIRHGNANHKRETIAFSKRRQAAAERFTVSLFHRNYMRRRRERRSGPTPAMLKGLLDRELGPKEVLDQRLFPDRVPLRGRWEDYYFGRVRTRQIARNRAHEPRFVY